MAAPSSLFASKLKALGTHLSLSALLVAGAFGLILLSWFPAPFYITDGAGDGLKLLVLVDMVLGPLLTFIVFNPMKTRRALWFDLSLIAIFQLGAYGAGLVSIHGVRIQAVAFDQGGFQTVNAAVYKEQTVEPKAWAALGTHEPYIVDVRAPATPDESSGVMAFSFTGGLSPYQLQFLYRPFARHISAYHWAAYRSDELLAAEPSLGSAAKNWLNKHGTLAARQLLFFPVQGYSNSAVLVLNEKGEWLGGFAGKLKPKPNPKPDAAPDAKPAPASASKAASAQFPGGLNHQ